MTSPQLAAFTLLLLVFPVLETASPGANIIFSNYYHLFFRQELLDRLYRTLCKRDTERTSQTVEWDSISASGERFDVVGFPDVTKEERSSEHHYFMCHQKKFSLKSAVECSRRSDVGYCLQEKTCHLFHLELVSKVYRNCDFRCVNIAWWDRNVTFQYNLHPDMSKFIEGPCRKTRALLPLDHQTSSPPPPHVPATTAVLDSSETNTADHHPKSSLPAEAKVGLAVAAVIIVVLIVVAAVVFICWRRRRRQAGGKTHATTNPDEPFYEECVVRPIGGYCDPWDAVKAEGIANKTGNGDQYLVSCSEPSDVYTAIEEIESIHCDEKNHAQFNDVVQSDKDAAGVESSEQATLVAEGRRNCGGVGSNQSHQPLAETLPSLSAGNGQSKRPVAAPRKRVGADLANSREKSRGKERPRNDKELVVVVSRHQSGKRGKDDSDLVKYNTIWTPEEAEKLNFKEKLQQNTEDNYTRLYSGPDHKIEKKTLALYNGASAPPLE